MMNDMRKKYLFCLVYLATFLFSHHLRSSSTHAFSNSLFIHRHQIKRIIINNNNSLCKNNNADFSAAFLRSSDKHTCQSPMKLYFFTKEEQLTQKEAQSAIDKVVAALRKDKTAQSELGNLVKVTNVLGYGSHVENSSRIIAVRFNAQFQKSGAGKSSIPLPFGMGQSEKSEGRGTMVGQVKAAVDEKTGKLKDCSVFRDLGYGRAFNLKC